MFKLGLTGGIGSGKTYVANLLAGWGASVIDTDQIAHALTAPEGLAIAPIRAAFGSDVIGPEGALDRARMRELVFSNPTERVTLEGILHPPYCSGSLGSGQGSDGLICSVCCPTLGGVWPVAGSN
jgi:dephospho-CoA kinase